MLHLFLTSTTRFLGIALGALFRAPDGVSRIRARRVLVMLGFLPVFALVQATHWLGFLLDEVFFRGYRRVPIREPLFVLGVPRSGTTNLHGVLARDRQFTTFSTWECLFAPSVSQRLFWRWLGRVDASIGAPLAGLLGRIEQRVFSGLDDVHAMGLRTPEEDYFALMPVLACFILVLPFPHSRYLWRMGSFDRDMPEPQRRRLLDFYASALRRHLYVHGPDKRLLSKNAAFAPLANSLADAFPDARFLVCLRDPVQTVPSQLSSIQGGLAFFGVPPDSAPIRERFIEQLAFYYANLRELAEHGAPTRTVTKTLPQLKADLAGSVRDAYRRLGIPLTPGFAATLSEAAAPARTYRSGHRYDLAEFGLNADAIARRFADAYTDPALTDGGSNGAGTDAASAAGPAERNSAPAATPVAMSMQAGGLTRC
jgi:hypothetical protein